jgi:hypothetical protein
VRHEDDGPTLHQWALQDVLEEEGSGMCVDRRQDVVQDKGRASRVKGSGERDASLLPAGAGRPLLADLGLVAELKDLEVALELASLERRKIANLIPASVCVSRLTPKTRRKARTNQGEPKTMLSLTDAPTSQGCCEQ